MKYIVSVGTNPENNQYKYIKILPTIGPNQLDRKLEADEAEQLIAENLLEFFAEKNHDAWIKTLVEKTRLGGHLIISILNGKKILWDLNKNNFTNPNAAIFGTEDISIKNLCFDINKFLTRLEEFGLKVLQVGEQDNKNIITCQKIQ